MKVCVFCGKEIKPGEAWTEDPPGSGNYWHSECHYKALREWLEKYKKGETVLGWKGWIEHVILERGYRPRKKTYIEELEEKLSKAGLDYIFEEVKKEKSEIYKMEKN